MRTSIRWVVWCFLWSTVLHCYVVNAQPEQLLRKNIVFDQLPDELGLSQSSINSVLQDKEGYLWIGTWSGLIRYDGYSTKVFYAENQPGKIKSNKITSIYEDSEGYLWIGTHMAGLFRYDKYGDKFFQYSNVPGDESTLSNNNIWAVQEDKSGNLWIATEHGLNFLEKGSNNITRFFYDGSDNSLCHDLVTSLCLASNGDLWIGTELGLSRLSMSSANDAVDYRFKTYFYHDDPASRDLHNYVYQINELLVNNKPVVWLNTRKGLKKIEDDVITNFLAPNKSTGYNVFRSSLVLKGTQPYILVGSEMELQFFDPLKEMFVKAVTNSNGDVNLSHSTITSLYTDRGGVLWVGTKKGLNRFNTYSKNFDLHLTSSFDPSGSIITGLEDAGHGAYWISTIGGGLFKLAGETFESYKIKSKSENDFGDFIQTLHRDRDGNLWIGTAGDGVYKVDPATVRNGSGIITDFVHFSRESKSPLSDSYVMSLADDNGSVWVGTWSQGLNKILPDGSVLQYTDSILRQVPLVTIHVDNSGTVWVGTRGNGLYKISQKKNLVIDHFHFEKDNANSLSNNFINTIYEDHAGGLWIGTEGGLSYFDRRSEKFTNYPIENGAGNNVVVSILEDDAGKLWIANWEGIVVFDPDSLKKTIRKFDTHDRIQGGFYYNNVCLKDENGKLLFGGSNGFNIIDASTLSQSPYEPAIVMKRFSIFNQPVAYGELFNDRIVLDKPLNQISRVVLAHDENSISFEFSALDYAAPEKIRYAYKLEGFDQSWNYTDASRRFANYTNLPDGRYTFRIRATNSDGLWNTSESFLNITIDPPWWKTGWALALYIFILIGVLYSFRKFTLARANLLHDIKLERVQRENMEKLNKAKLQFFTNISHEFRTPLTLILGPVQHLLDSNEGGKFVREQMMIINNNAQRLLRLVNQLLDFRKAESGNMKLEVTEGNIVYFIKEIKLSFDALAEEMKIDFSFHASSNIIKAWFDRDQFEKIVFNLLSNAFKHTPEGGRISIQVIEAASTISMIVEDNGKGIKPEHFENIFQTFFSYDQDKHHTGTGIGLALTKTLVDLHHGNVKVESVANKFTRFIVNIPSGKNHFDPSELASTDTSGENIMLYPPSDEINASSSRTEYPAQQRNLADLHKVLVVEDNKEVRSYLRSLLIGKYVVLEAEEGKEAIDIALEESPDLVISDVMMPIMDGISLCKQLKSNVKTSHIPVILLTARTSLIFKVEGLETGADDYVTKPFNPTLLLLKVQNIIASREAMRQMFQDHKMLNIEPKRVAQTSADELFIEKALESIETNMANADYSVEEFGRDLGMSRTQLYRKLKGLTGQSPNEFIRTIRLKRAAQLLEQQHLTIAEITYMVGFTDLQYFRDCFKKLFGTTPSDFIQRHASAGTWSEDKD